MVIQGSRELPSYDSPIPQGLYFQPMDRKREGEKRREDTRLLTTSAPKQCHHFSHFIEENQSHDLILMQRALEMWSLTGQLFPSHNYTLWKWSFGRQPHCHFSTIMSHSSDCNSPLLVSLTPFLTLPQPVLRTVARVIFQTVKKTIHVTPHTQNKVQTTSLRPAKL